MMRLKTQFLQWFTELLLLIICLVRLGICILTSFIIQSFQEGTCLIKLLLISSSFFRIGSVIHMIWFRYLHLSLWMGLYSW